VAVSAEVAMVQNLYETLRRLREQGLTLLLAEQAVDLAQHPPAQHPTGKIQRATGNGSTPD